MPHLDLEYSANVPDEPDFDLVLLRESFPRAREEREGAVP